MKIFINWIEEELGHLIPTIVGKQGVTLPLCVSIFLPYQMEISSSSDT